MVCVVVVSGKAGLYSWREQTLDAEEDRNGIVSLRRFREPSGLRRAGCVAVRQHKPCDWARPAMPAVQHLPDIGKTSCAEGHTQEACRVAVERGGQACGPLHHLRVRGVLFSRPSALHLWTRCGVHGCCKVCNHSALFEPLSGFVRQSRFETMLSHVSCTVRSKSTSNRSAMLCSSLKSMPAILARLKGVSIMSG
jgi:hypothetical protein